MLLNSYGTEAMFNLVQNWTWLQNLGLKEDWYFVGSRLFVSLMVSWFWNFALQRYFVYRRNPVDKYIVRILGGKTVDQSKDNNNKPT